MLAVLVYHLKGEIVMVMDCWDWIWEGGASVVL